jgi:hypothetical protein
MATETVSQILFECEFRFHHVGKHFMEPSDYDEIQLCKILYSV